MPRGGARPGSGPKKKAIVPTSAVSVEAQRRSKVIYDALVRDPEPEDSPEIKKWRLIVDHEPAYLWKMFEHAEGRAVHTVNHLHDKPIEMNVHLDLSARIAGARRRAALGIDAEPKRRNSRS